MGNKNDSHMCSPFFSERLFHQICGIPTSPTLVDEVGDHIFREQLIKVSEWLIENFIEFMDFVE